MIQTIKYGGEVASETEEQVITTLEKYYDLDEMAGMLGIPKEKIALSSKGLAKTLQKSAYFSTLQKKGREVQELITAIATDKRIPKDKVVKMYGELVEVYGAGGTHSEMIFLRHARKHFSRKTESRKGLLRRMWSKVFGY